LPAALPPDAWPADRRAVPPALGEITSRELRARQWHIRSFTANAVCTTCHGTDALRRFMYSTTLPAWRPIAGSR